MARDDNSFALLGDNEGDDISTFLAHVALKAEASSATAEKKKKKNEQSHHSHSPPSKALPPQSVRTESRGGTGGQGHGLGRSSRNDVQQFEEGYANSYQPNNRGANVYKQNSGGTDGYGRYNRGFDGPRRNGGVDVGYQQSIGNADGYQGSYGGDTAGNTDDGNWQGWVHKGTRARGRGRGHGGARGRGFGQGRALNEGNGFEKESQFVECNQQLENKDQGVGTGDGWEHVTEDHSSYGGERRDNDGGGGGYKTWGDSFFGVHNGNNYEVMNTSGPKEALSSNGGDDDSGIVAETTEVSKDAFQDAAHDSSGKKAEDEEAKEAMRTQEALEKEAKRKAWEEEKKEEAKKMTLEQYQKVLLEKRKALEALKTEERKAVCSREENIAMIIAQHYQPLAWAKWCRRLPRIVASATRILDFYMEITFHFESSVIPFIGRIAPSDTYRIWKRGSNFRVDMTLAGFDGFRIQRSDQTFLFLGEGYSSEDGNISLPPGSLIVLAHKEKEITNALEGAGAQPTEAEVAHEVALMSQTNMYRPGIDVTQAELVPHLNWRRQERTEVVGNWKAKIYDMLHVMVSVKSRRVPGAMTDEELFSVDDDERTGNGGEHDDDVLTAEERMQLDSALRMGNSDVLCEDEDRGVQDGHANGDSGSYENAESKEKKSWFGWNKKGSKHGGGDDSKILKKFSKLAPEGSNQRPNDGQRSSSEFPREDMGDAKKSKDKCSKKKKMKGATSEPKSESEYKKGLRPVLWLTPDFPLKTEELLPLLDILANKVKAVRRLRELLTTKLPQGTFPVKIAVPIVPTIRVLITFTKFEELQPMEEFSTPPCSPMHFEDAKSKESEGSTSWMSWMRGSRGGQSSDSEGRSFRDEIDSFQIPSNYAWVDANEKKRRMKAKKAKNRKHRKQTAAKSGDSGRQASEDLEE